MAKKYLLYIHDSRFEKEQEKSKLVNDLLFKHYGGVEVVGEWTPKLSKKTAALVELSMVNDGVEVVKETPIPNSRLENGLCKIHGTPLDARGRCMQKGCKYS